MNSQFKTLASVAFLSLGLSSCGGESLSGDVKMELLPDNPLVVTADITIGGGDDAVVVEGPWFETRYAFTNNSDQNLVVVTLHYTVTGTKKGAPFTVTYDLDPGENCGDLRERPYLAYVPPGGKFSGLKKDGSEALSRCITTDPLAPPEDYDSQHIEPPLYEPTLLGNIGDDLDSTILSVQVEAAGWFEKPSTGEITERLYLSGFFSTR